MDDDYSRMTVKEFLTALSSSSPTPGGGSAAAISLGNAAALTCMVCDLTLSKEKWKDSWELVEKIQSIAAPIFLDSFELANNDALSFNKVMDAWKLPKNTDDEAIKRKNEINDATLNAALVPLETAKKASAILELLPELAEYGNSNAITDVAVAALLAHSSAIGAIYNVRINLLDLDEVEIKEKTIEISKNAEINLSKTLEIVERKMS
ncbi:MAG: methenyltetrahydrofolate cyclohydrolase [Euryarchaeota archaeon]|nr:methenyltetrahydrofolate cyclohydrolase [Euryarchaeota archaeon]